MNRRKWILTAGGLLVPMLASGIPPLMMRRTLPTQKKAAVAGGGGDWTPTSVSGLQLWLKADVGVYSDAGTTPATNGGLVQQWNDQSGNSKNVTQTDAEHKMTYRTAKQNGLPALDSTGGARMFDASSLSVGAGSKTFFVAISVSGVTTTSQYLFDSQTGRLVIANVADSESTAGWYDASWNHFSTMSTGWHTLIWVLTAGATSYVYLDGTQMGVGATYTSRAIGGSSTINGRYDQSSSDTLGYYGEVGIYDSALSSGNQASLQSYLKNRWATP